MYSTSLSPVVSVKFTHLADPDDEDECCLLSDLNNKTAWGYICRIKIPKGPYKCLWMSNSKFMHEREILLPDKSLYLILNQFHT